MGEEKGYACARYGRNTNKTKINQTGDTTNYKAKQKMQEWQAQIEPSE